MNDVLMIRASRHTNIVNYIDSFLYKNELWVVMERVDGCLLTDVIRENPLSNRSSQQGDSTGPAAFAQARRHTS